MDTDRAKMEEKERIIALLFDYQIDEKRIRLLEPVVENVAWMKVKLDEARGAIKHSNVVIPYDNGGGQTGLRENPLFKGYEALWKSYMSGMSKLLDNLPEEKAKIEDDAKSDNVLQMIRAKRRKQA